MKIPSYDDLTPSIPDVEPADVFGSVDRLMPPPAPVGIGRERSARTPVCSGRIELYAALHGESADTLVAIAREFSPRIQRHGTTDIVFDVSGLERLLGDAATIAAELARAGAGRVAVAPSRIAARLLARGVSGVSVVTGDPEAALSTIPLTVLCDLVTNESNPPEIAHPSPFDVIHRWGLKTLGEFATLPASELSARLGQRGIRLQRLARGIDPRPLVPDPDSVRFVESMELEWPIDALEPLSFVFARLLEPLSAALERADRGAAAIRLDLRLTNRVVHTRVLQLPVAMRDPRVLRTLLLLDLESNPPAAAIDIVTIEADPAPARIVQYSLLERALPSPETLATLTARLDALAGADRCGSPVLLDTYRPDAFEMVPFSTHPGTVAHLGALRSGGQAPGHSGTVARLGASRSGGQAPGHSGTVAPWHSGTVAPWHSGTLTPCLRRFRPPVAVRVTVEHGRPVQIAIDRQGMPGGRVVQAAGPWRTSGGWWEGTPWDRDEWDVVCRDGAACRISRDRLSDVWFVEGVFD